jgi:hypothetical protein
MNWTYLAQVTRYATIVLLPIAAVALANNM